MTYSVAAILALSLQCAPSVAPQTIAAIVATESQGEPFALNVNRGPRLRPAATPAAAAALAQRYVAAGYSVDLGLGQINSRNMRKLGLTWQTVFDPCTNLAALGRILTDNYQAALGGREPQTALRIAFSLYNTGNTSRGFRNGYVGRVVGNAGVSDLPDAGPPLSAAVVEDDRFGIVTENTVLTTTVLKRDAVPPAWNIFARAAYARRAALPSTAIRSRSVWSE